MADQKISQLTDGGNSQATDEYVIARSGANYRIDGASIAAAATSVGTLSSLAVTGDLTVDTSTLKVDSTNNRVGIGTASPGTGYRLHIVDSGNTVGTNTPLFLSSANGVATTSYGWDNLTSSYDYTIKVNGSTTALTISNTGNLAVDTNTLYVDAANNRVGVGTASPAAPLHVAQSSSAVLFSQDSTTATIVGTNAAGNSSQGLFLRGFPLTFTGNGGGGAEQMRLDASGNLGLGVTPSAWTSASRVLQIGGATNNRLAFNGTVNTVSSNAYWDTANNRWEYIGTGNAVAYAQDTGSHVWLTSASGTADNPITFTQAMTLDASGNLGVGTTGPSSFGKAAIVAASGTTSFYTGTGAQGLYISTDDSTRMVLYASSGNFSGGHRWNVGNTEAARITAGSYFKASPNGTYNNATGTYHEFVSTSDNTGTVVVKHTGTSGAQYGITITTVNDQNDATRYFWSGEGAGVERGTLRSNGGLANYSANNVNLASDERLKKDIAPLTSTWDKLKAIEVVNFRYKDCNEDDPALYGVIAQQVQPIVPELVVVTREAVEAKDAVLDEDGNEVEPAVEAKPEYYGIREQPMYWLAIKALQEAQARIESLEARLAALES